MILRRKVPPEVKRLYRECIAISKANRNYLYGGGHTKPLAQITAHEALDCSGSVGLALKRAGLVNFAWAPPSSLYNRVGVAGKGRYFTIMYSGAHVWIAFHRVGLYRRFDTSPWSDTSGNGPRMRITPRSHRGFRMRHFRGC